MAILHSNKFHLKQGCQTLLMLDPDTAHFDRTRTRPLRSYGGCGGHYGRPGGGRYRVARHGRRGTNRCKRCRSCRACMRTISVILTIAAGRTGRQEETSKHLLLSLPDKKVYQSSKERLFIQSLPDAF